MIIAPEGSSYEIQRVLRVINSKIKITENNCYEFQGARTEFGYGQVWFNNKLVNVHRVISHIFQGLDLNSDLKSLHKCDNPPCCNQDHLFVGTNADNMLDCSRKGRTRGNRAKKTHCKRGHELTKENSVIKSPDWRRRCRTCLLNNQNNRRAIKKAKNK